MIAAAALLAAAALPALAAFGLAVRFPDMVLEHVEPGAVFRARKDKNIPYVVINRTDGPVDVEVLAEPARPDVLKPGYEPVPDAAWIAFEPARFTLQKGEEKPVELTLKVPKDKSLVGRHFQAGLHARTVGTGFLAAGVLHVMSISVGAPAPAAPKKKEK